MRSLAIAGGVALVALALRLAYLEQAERHPLFLVPVETENQAPLYAHFLAAIDADAPRARWVQAVLSALSCGLLWLVGRAVFVPSIALAAGVAAAFYGPMIYFAGELLPATAVVFFSLLALWAVLWADGSPALWRFLPGGLFLGLALACGMPAPALGALFCFAAIRERRDGRALAFAAAAGGLLAGACWLGGTKPQITDGWSILLGLYHFWHGVEWMPNANPYFMRESSAVLAALLWDRGLAFPFGIVAPLALVGVGYRLFATERSGAENALLLFMACSMTTIPFVGAPAAMRLPIAVVLLIFACVGAAELMRRWRAWPLWGATAFVPLVIALNASAGLPQGAPHYWLGYAYQTLDLPASALREYQRAVELETDFPAPHYALGELHDAKGEHDKAAAAYRALLKRWPEATQARERLAATHVRAGQPTAAVSLYQPLLDQGSDPVALLGRLGDAQYLSGDLPGAAQSYERLLSLRPDSSRAQYQLAQMSQAEGRIDAALQGYSALLSREEYAREAALQLAALLVEIDHQSGVLAQERETGWWREEGLVAPEVLQAAEARLVAALAKRPDSSADLWGLGKLLFWQGRYREALARVAALAEATPDDYRVHFFLSKLHGLLGEERAAQAAFAQYQRQKQHATIAARVQTERDVLLKQLSGKMP